MKYITSIIALSFLCSLFAQDVPISFTKANATYQAGDFPTSADLYEQSIREGFVNSEVYYNLGNAYFKSNNIAHSILAYERAYFLNPRDEDIKNNLNYARLFASDKINSMYQGTFLGTFWSFLRMVSYNDVKLLLIISSMIAVILLFIHLISIRQRHRIYLKISNYFWAITIFFLVVFIVKMNDRWLLNSAIVVQESLDINSSPTSEGELLFTLHPGTKVAIKSEFGDFLRVAIEDGREGWAKMNGLERVIPK
jgi:tetratricopeptide (TPR) repeat protein